MPTYHQLFKHAKPPPKYNPPKRPPVNVERGKKAQQAAEYGHRMAAFNASPLGQKSRQLAQQQYKQSFSPSGRGRVQGFKYTPKPKPHLGFSLRAGIAGGFKGDEYLVKSALGIPGGIKATVQHPIRVGEQVAKTYKHNYSSWKNFKHYFNETGSAGPALDIFSLASAGTNVGAKTGLISKERLAQNTLAVKAGPGKMPVPLSQRDNPLLQLAQRYRTNRQQAVIDAHELVQGNLQKDLTKLRNRHEELVNSPKFLSKTQKTEVLSLQNQIKALEAQQNVPRGMHPLNRVGRQIRATERNLWEAAGGREGTGKTLDHFIYKRIYGTGKEYSAGERIPNGMVPIRKTVNQETGDVSYSRAKQLERDNQSGDLGGISEKRLKGVKWVDRRLVKESGHGEVGSAPPFLKLTDAINAPFKFLQVYARPAFTVNNHLQMVAQGLALHGPKYMGAYYHAIAHVHPPPIREWVHQAMGTTRVQAIMHPESQIAGETIRLPGGKIVKAPTFERTRGVARKIENLQSKATDQIPREAFFYVRAAQKGIKTTEQLAELKKASRTSAAAKRKLDSIIQAAQDDSIHFSSMTKGERYMASVVYFYPYLSRAVRWSGRFAAERPVTTNVLMNLGNVGAQNLEKQLGPHPDWLEGYIKTKGGLVNPSPFSTAATPAQIVQGLSPSTFNRNLAQEFGTPTIQALLAERTSATQKSPLNEIPYLGGVLAGAVPELVGSTAPATLLKRMGITYAPIMGPIPKTWKVGKGYKRFLDAFGPYLFGGIYPRPYHPEQVAAQARRAGKAPKKSGGSGGGGSTQTPSYLPSGSGGGASYIP